MNLKTSNTELPTVLRNAEHCSATPDSLVSPWLLVLCLFFLGLFTSLASDTNQFQNADCLDCHSDPTTSRIVNGKNVPLPVFPTNDFCHSVHPGLHCTDCHTGVKDLVHDPGLPPPDCGHCHQKEAKDYATSIHGMSRMMGSSAAAACWDCHGSHDILAVTNPASPVYKMNLPFTCAKCHSNSGLTRQYRIQNPNAATEFEDSIHGQALLKMGLIVAPSCDDCHGVHDIKPAVYPDSTVNHANIAKTCGKCHVGIEKIYDQSIHGQLLAKGDSRGPVCTDCHTAHEIVNPAAVNGFKEAMDERCGKCHPTYYKYYRDTYHGKAILLGEPNRAPKVAACYDCHGYHDIQPPSDLASHLSRTNILATCQQCHAGATIGFTKYDPHANPEDAKRYPLFHAVFLGMTGLLIGTFAFFGLHTVAWFVRAGYLYLHDSKRFRDAKTATQVDGEWFTRFVPFERFLHIMVVSSFLLLVITGMPLKFYYTAWAKVIFSIIGGPETARTLHRFGAVITFTYFSLHLISLVGKAWKGRNSLRDENGRLRFKRLWQILFGPDSMMPSVQDWRDLVAHNKWFFGKGPRPQFDRWTYWEKFDYFAVFWGVAIIGASGLIMWFPTFFTRFLPGWVINIALIVHSDEALLAAGFIFSIHFFNTHFRIEKFPMDTVIFSGRVSKTEMLHERKRWYDRLVATGRLDDHRVRDEWFRWKNIAKFFGYFFFGLGMVLLLLIIYAMITRLAH